MIGEISYPFYDVDGKLLQERIINDLKTQNDITNSSPPMVMDEKGVYILSNSNPALETINATHPLSKKSKSVTDLKKQNNFSNSSPPMVRDGNEVFILSNSNPALETIDANHPLSNNSNNVVVDENNFNVVVNSIISNELCIQNFIPSKIDTNLKNNSSFDGIENFPNFSNFKNELQITIYKDSINNNDRIISSAFHYCEKLNIDSSTEQKTGNQIILLNNKNLILDKTNTDLNFLTEANFENLNFCYDLFVNDLNDYFNGQDGVELVKKAISSIDENLQFNLRINSLKGIYFTIAKVIKDSSFYKRINTNDYLQNATILYQKLKDLLKDQCESLENTFKNSKLSSENSSKIISNTNARRKIENNFILVNSLFELCKKKEKVSF